MLVKIVKDWGEPDILRQSPKGNGVWDSITFTTEEVNQCDLLIVLNRPYKKIEIEARETWLLSQESPIEHYRWHTDSFKYFDRVFTFWGKEISENIIHAQTALPWHINKSYDALKKINENSCIHKANRVSWVTSNANNKPGHELRLQFMDFLNKQCFEYDLFGRGFNAIDDKFYGIFPYKYSLAIENYSCNDYWTEKISDCFLSWAMPIYNGAKNITNYFPEESMLLIDPSRPDEALEIIREAVESDRWMKNIEYIKESRNLILEKYQLFPYISGLIYKYRVSENIFKLYNIPENDPKKASKVNKAKLFLKKQFN